MSTIKNFKINTADESGNLERVGFMMGKDCGSGNEGLVVALTVNYLDNLIVAQNYESNNFMFLYSHLVTAGLPAEPLSGFITSIYQKIGDLNAFTVSCRTPEMYELLAAFGRNLLKIKEPSNEEELKDKLREFSETFNMQINIYETGRNHPIVIQNNRFTDALILTIYKKIQLDKTFTYYALYHKDYSHISKENLNYTTEFNGESIPSDYFIPITAIRLMSKDLKDFIITDDQFTEIQESFNNLSANGVIWPFDLDLRRFLSEFEPCIKCNKLRVSKTFSCTHKLCKYCSKVSIDINKCSFCSAILVPNDMN